MTKWKISIRGKYRTVVKDSLLANALSFDYSLRDFNQNQKIKRSTKDLSPTSASKIENVTPTCAVAE